MLQARGRYLRAGLVGTGASLARNARERLRGRLTRRGLATGMALLDGGRSPIAPLAAIPQDLFTATVRASLSFAEKPAIAAGVASTRAVALARGVIQSMTIYRLKVLFAAVMIGTLVPCGLWAFGVLGDGRGGDQANAEAPAGGPGQEAAVLSGVAHIDRIGFDQLYVGAIAEARPWFKFVGVRDPVVS